MSANTRVVYKFNLPITDGDAPVKMPPGAQILHVDQQNPRDREGHKYLQLWAMVDPRPKIAREQRWFRVIGTGHRHDDIANARHIGTVLPRADNGAAPLVWHVFEVTP